MNNRSNNLDCISKDAPRYQPTKIVHARALEITPFITS